VRAAAGVLLAVVVIAGGAFLLLQVVAARDEGQVVARGPSGPGERMQGECTPADAVIPRDRGRLTDEQILHALELGNVVLLSPRPSRLLELQESVSGPYDAELAAAGQMVILGRGGAETGVTALAFDHRLEADGPGDPELREFAEAWLGNTAGRSCD